MSINRRLRRLATVASIVGLIGMTGPNLAGRAAEVDAGAAPTANTSHIRRALYRVDDANHFTTAWEFFRDDQNTMTELDTFTRTGK